MIYKTNIKYFRIDDYLQVFKEKNATFVKKNYFYL